MPLETPAKLSSSHETEQTPFAEFTVRHEHLNRFFWSTDASYHLVNAQIQSLPDDLPVRKLVAKTLARQYTFGKYLAQYHEGQPRQRAAVADLKKDLLQNVRHLAYSIVVQEASNLEEYLRDWTMEAAHIELGALGEKPSSRREQLLDILKDLRQNSRLSISLRSLAKYFPVVIKTLDATTHKRSHRPFLSMPISGVTCFDAAQMWREVRNLIVHHGGRINRDFIEAWSPIWDKIIDDAVQSGSNVQRANLKLTKRIPLSKRHVVFCLATCFQTAVVLHIALGGQPPIDPKRHLQNLAEP